MKRPSKIKLMSEQESMLDRYLNYLHYNMGFKRATLQNKRQHLGLLYSVHGGEILWISDYNTIHGLILRAAERGCRKPWDRNTTHKCFCYMKDYYWWANTVANVVPHNPMANGFKYRKAPRKEPVVLRKELWTKLWASPFMTVRDIAIHILFEATGVRKAELVSLNVGDCDFRSGARMIHVKCGKRDKFRWIPINKRYSMYMRIYLNFLKEQGLAGPEMPLFPREDGKRLSGNRVHRMIRERGLELGIRAFPHAKRHGYITERLEDGMPIEAVREAAGHANISQTADYTHLAKEHLKKELDRVSA